MFDSIINEAEIKKVVEQLKVELKNMSRGSDMSKSK